MASSPLWYDAAVNSITGLLNGGSMRIYTGSQPALDMPLTGTLLVTLTFSATAFTPSSASTATANPITGGAAVAAGTAGYFALVAADGVTVVCTGSVSTDGANLNLSSLAVSSGQLVQCNGFTITGGAVPPETVTIFNPGGQTSTAGTAVSLQIVASDSAGAALTYTATGLPAGLSIAGVTGVISGTPSAAQTTTVTVTATSPANVSASASFLWTVTTGAPTNKVTVTNPGSQTSTVGTPVSLQILASDSATGQVLTYTAAGLPAGLSINASTGIISGTPTTASAPGVTVTATDGLGVSGSATFLWTVNSSSTGGGGSNPPPGGHTCTVDFRTVAHGGGPMVAVDPLGVGMVCSEFGGNPVPLVGNPTWIANMTSLHPGSVRASLAWYGGNPGYGAGGSARAPGTGAALVGAIKAIGAIPLISYNGDTSDNGGLTTAGAAGLVHYFNDGGGRNGGPVQYWSIGNEPEVAGPTPAYASLLPAMTAASPGINVGCPAASYWDTGLLGSVTGIPGLGCLSWHEYDGGNGGGDGFPANSSYAPHCVSAHAMAPGKLIGVEEINWNFAGAPNDWHDTLFIADVAGILLSNGAHMNVYADNNSGLGILSDGSAGPVGTPMAPYYGMAIWTGGGLGIAAGLKRYSGQMVPTTNSLSSSTLTIYACDNGKIVVCNKSGSNQAISIGLGGTVTGTYNVWATSQSVTTPIAKVVNAASYSGSVISYTVPAQTAVSIDVTIIT